MKPAKIKPLTKSAKTKKKLSNEQLQWLDAMEYHFPNPNKGE